MIDPIVAKSMVEATEQLSGAIARGAEAAERNIRKFPDAVRPGMPRYRGTDRDGAHAVDSAVERVSGGAGMEPPGAGVAGFGPNDEPLRPLAHLKPSSECRTDYETNRAQHWSRFAEDRGLTLDEFIAQADDHAAALVRDSYVCTRVSGPTLQKVLDSGEIKSFFDTGKTSIFDHQLQEYVPSHKALFGYGADLPPEGRPIYGYLTRDPLGRDLYGGHLSGYGTAAVVFKPQIAERTTITLNDSLAVATHSDEMKVGMSLADPLTNPTSNMFRRNENPFTYQTPESVNPYIEAQIHRLTSTPSGTELSPLRADSIDRVTFLSGRSEYPSELFDTLDSQGIPYSFAQDPPAAAPVDVEIDFV
ncbi:hypothetical protein [Nocardia sp. NPDC056100]|uniref:hypothetical protein n=1 Tax=Nocardia sp. NPDC056100 TaxID=3345712 RepID=UPI0035D99761